MDTPCILVVDDNQELLSLLSQVFEDAGYRVVAVNKGRPALDAAREAPPSVAVLDLLLPDMMGYSLAEQLRKEWPGLPLIFVTGVFKGGKHATEAQAKFPGSSYFEKPFEATKLVEAVKKVAPPPAKKESAESMEDAFDLELDIDVEEEDEQDPMELTGRVRVTGGGNLSAELHGDKLTAAPAQKPQPTAASAKAAAAGATASAVTKATPPAPSAASPAGVQILTPAASASSGAGRARRGELKDNLPSLITAFYLSGETGELGVQKGKVKKLIYFEKGTPVFALSNLAADRFGQFLVRVGKVTQDQLADAGDAAKGTGRRAGDVLVERGVIKEAERLYYVAQQVKAIIYSLFAWEEGIYVMGFKERAAAESIKLDVHPANLIVRGVKKLYKPERLRKLLEAEDRLIPSLQPAYALHEVELEKWEAEFLPKVDGTRTISELLAQSGRPEHVVLGFLYSMVALSILDRRT